MRHIARHLLAAAALVVVAASVPVAVGGAPRDLAGNDDLVHLNQIQVIGTHNSYHQLATDPERALREKFLGSEEGQFEYYHRALPIQFASEKVRQIELDVFNDPKGGLYAHPLIRSITGEGAYDDAVMDQPGFKVLHAQDVDYHSSCLTFIDCLTEVKAWSDANPTHAPIAILVELKDEVIDTGTFTFVHPLKFDASAMDHLDGEIRSVFPPAGLITPDDVRGSYPTLADAVTHGNWPTLGQSRGKVMFLMDNADYRTQYLVGHPDLEGRVLFTNAAEGDPDAAFIEDNDPVADQAKIQHLVKEGYVVRTRADDPDSEAVTNDHSTQDAAFASGAQWVSTDYPVPGYSDGYHSGGYVAAIPGGTVGRCDPVNAPAGCDSSLIDTIFTPAARPAGIDPPVSAAPATTTTTTVVAGPSLPPAPITPGGPVAPPAVPIVEPRRFTG